MNKNLHRIKIIKGHIAAIEKMIEEEKYCIDILHQSLAVQKALKKLDTALMESHISHCVANQAKRGEIQKVVSDLVGIFKYK